MLEITIKENEFYNATSNKFIQIPECTLTLEHSLISIAKWESKWCTPYFDGKEKTSIQDLDYIRCMVVGPMKNEQVLNGLTQVDIAKIQAYISAPMTATTFTNHAPQSAGKKEIMTAEVIYARMFAHHIPLDCQKWHLNRLLTVIKVCDLQNSPREKMSKSQSAAWAAQQNAARRAKYNSKG